MNGQLQQARRKQNCIGPAYWYLYPSAYVSVYAKARWVWGHAPPGKFFDIECYETAPEAILGPKTSLLFIAFNLTR